MSEKYAAMLCKTFLKINYRYICTLMRLVRKKIFLYCLKKDHPYFFFLLGFILHKLVSKRKNIHTHIRAILLHTS